MKIIDFSSSVNNSQIDINTLKNNVQRLNAGLIAPAKEEVHRELANEHAAEPIKSISDINKVVDYLIKNKYYRDNMLFIAGINFGLRASDLRKLRFSDVINEDYTFKTSFSILEQKTKNTRKHKKNRYISINKAVIDAITLFLENTPNVSMSDYMFRSISNHGKNNNEPIEVVSIERMLKRVAKKVGLNIKISTHTLRKTFGYHQMAMSGHDSRKLLVLQKMFGHSSPMQTLDYIGITKEEIEDAYMGLNLGSVKNNYVAETKITERMTG